MKRLRLFTPGPVPIDARILAIGAEQPPYNRTGDFSEFTREIIEGLKYVFQTQGSVVLLTGSGTAAMEASVLSFLGTADRALVINGGAFGERWCDLCEVHSIPYDEHPVPLGGDIDLALLDSILSENRYTALLVNAHETSTGHLYDIEAIGKIAKLRGVFFLVDAISSICADDFFMDDWHVDAAILSSQKALALPPGLSFIAMNQSAKNRLLKNPRRSLYFDLNNYLLNQQRGQLPYTPAIGIMMQLHQRLLDIQQQTLCALVQQHRERAESFRQSLAGSNFKVLPARPSNALTALVCDGLNAADIVEALRSRFDIVVTPNGGELRSKVFRVAHMGAQEDADIACLLAALEGFALPELSTTRESVKL